MNLQRSPLNVWSIVFSVIVALVLPTMCSWIIYVHCQRQDTGSIVVNAVVERKWNYKVVYYDIYISRWSLVIISKQKCKYYLNFQFFNYIDG